MKSYDYAARKGVDAIGWGRFATLSRRLAQRLAARDVDCVVGVARAGLIVASTVACALRVDLLPVAVTRRSGDRVVRQRPAWRVRVPASVRGRVVAVIDDMADTGETLALVAAAVRRQGAVRVVTAALASHTWSDPKPDETALATDALVVFPWDSRVLSGGKWGLHPELEGATALQRRLPPQGPRKRSSQPPQA